MNTDINFKKHILIAFGLGLCCFLITAINSHGYFHADEHYQIIEFAGKLLGTHQDYDLAWEHAAQIRPTIQVYIAASMIRGSQFLSIEDPYVQAMILRLLSAVLSLIVIFKLVKSLMAHFETKAVQYLLIYSSFLLWFIPYLGVRFSSETWSGLFFTLGLTSFWNKSEKANFSWLGIYFALAFLFRFQIAFAELAVILFWLSTKKLNYSQLWNFSRYFLLIIVLGSVLDTVFYGEFTFTPWNYFESNILDSKAAEYGLSPFYYYLNKLLFYPTLPLGILFYISLVYQGIFKRNEVWWAFLIFLLAHSLVGHKEERFLFPFFALFPYLLLSGFDQILKRLKAMEKRKPVIIMLTSVFVFTSLIGLPTLAFKAAGIGHMGLSQIIHNTDSEKIQLIYMDWSSPYNPFGLKAKFYNDSNLEEIHLANLCDLNKDLFDPKLKTFLVLRVFDYEHSTCQVKLEEMGFHLRKSSIPAWTNRLNNYYGGYENHVTILLFEK